ncbi:MAG: hypothetical protein V8Q30_12570 [Acutalibacteraceae bacterium]
MDQRVPILFVQLYYSTGLGRNQQKIYTFLFLLLQNKLNQLIIADKLPDAAENPARERGRGIFFRPRG